MRFFVAALLLLPLLAGCTADPAYQLGGAFASERTEDDMADFDATARAYSDDIAIMESSPEQFSVGNLSAADCDALRGELLEKDYLQRIDDCIEETGSADGDLPTSSPYARQD